MSIEKKPEQTEGLIAFEDLFKSNEQDPFLEPDDNGQQGVIITDPDARLNDDLFDPDDTNQNREKQQDNGEIDLITPVSKILSENLIDLGVETIIQVDEVGNEVEVDVKSGNITPEMYKEALKSYLENQKEKLLEDALPLKGTSDLLKKLAEIDKAGGNITAILEEKANVVDPLQSIDISNEQGQITAIELVLKAQNMSPEDIEARILLYKTKGILADKAEEFQENVQKAFDDYLENQKKAAEDNKVKQKEAIKEYRKDFVEGLGGFELNDTVKKKLVKFATETESDGFVLDKRLREMRMDPKRAARLALFVLDEEEFIKQVTAKAITATRQKTAIKIGLAKDKRQATDNDDLFGSSSSKKSGGLIPIE